MYNTGNILYHCLNSIIKNTYKNLEIICINDGSKDNSLSVLQGFAEIDDRIVIIDQQNSGVSHSRNVGLMKATGDYIAFIDSDDYIHPQYFEILINAICDNNADIAIGGYKEVYNFDEPFDICSQAPEFKQLTYDHLKPPHSLRSYIWGRIYKKSLTVCVN